MALTRVTRILCGVAGSVLVVGAVIVVPMAASAAPSPTPAPTKSITAPAAPKTAAEATALLADLAIKNEKLTEQLNQAKIDVAKAQRAADQANLQFVQSQAAYLKAQRALATMVSAQYKAPSFSRTAAILSSPSGQNYLETVQMLNLISSHQSDVAEVAQAAINETHRAEAAAKAAVASAVAKRDAVNKQQASLQDQIVKYKALLATLSAAERARYLDQQMATPAQVAAVATKIASPSVTSAAIAVSKNAAGAVKAALSQQGKPYVWGAAGPDAYDCSGLTMWAWAQAGVSLPHQAAAQQGMLPPVSRDQLQPGDLVFFGSPAYHVGMYIGDGLMVHAPTSGDVVKVVSLDVEPDYSGAGRPG